MPEEKVSKSYQNVLSVCTKSFLQRNNMLRRLAEKGFVLCTVVLRKDAHVVDRCEVSHTVLSNIQQRFMGTCRTTQ